MSDAPRKIRHAEGLIDFLALGEGRSRSMLLDRYKADPDVITPGDGTMKRWSSKYNWIETAKAHDAGVVHTAVAQIAEQQVTAVYNRIAAVEGLASELLRTGRVLLARLETDTSLTTDDVVKLLDKFLECTRALEVMGGGVSDRTETKGGQSIAEKIDDLFRSPAGQPGSRDPVVRH